MSEMMAGRGAEVIAAEINAIKLQTRTVVLTGAIEIGRRLYEAKAVVAHGQWGAWLEHNVDYSERTAQNLMRVFEEYENANPQTYADLSYSNAVAMLGLPRELRDALMETGNVQDMSARALQEEIAKLKAENEKQQMTIDGLMEDAAAKCEAWSKEAEAQAYAALQAAKREAQEARAALEGIRGELALAKTGADERTEFEKQAKEAEKKAKDADARTARLEEQLKAAKAEVSGEVVERRVEVMPEAALRELEALREVAAKAPSEAVIRLRDGYRRMIGEFENVAGLLDALMRESPGEAEKYMGALRKAVEKMLEKWGG